MDPITVLVVGAALVGAFYFLERGTGGSSGVIVRPTVSVTAPAPSAPAGSADQRTLPIPPTGSGPSTNAPVQSPQTPQGSTPKPSDLLTKPADTLSWVFANGTDALKAGYGQIYRNDRGGLSITGPHGAILLANPGTIYGSESEALRAGPGNFFQRGGDYFVTGPNAATKVSDRFQPHVAQADLSTYGSVKGVIRGWTAQADRTGALTFVPAHGVSGSTYFGDAQGDAPTKAEWDALASKL